MGSKHSRVFVSILNLPRCVLHIYADLDLTESYSRA